MIVHSLTLPKGRIMGRETSARPRPMARAGWLFFGLGMAELLAGWLFNPVLLVIAAHDIVGDGLPFLLYDQADRRFERSKRHFVWCIARKLLNLAVPPLAILSAWLAFWFEPSETTSVVGCALTIGIGAVNFYSNLLAHRWLHHGGDKHHHSARLHVLLDMASGPIAAAGSIGALVFHSSSWNYWAAFSILVVIILGMLIAFKEAVSMLINHEAGHGPIILGSHPSQA